MLVPANGCNSKAYPNGTTLNLVARSSTNYKFPDTFKSLRSLHFFLILHADFRPFFQAFPLKNGFVAFEALTALQGSFGFPVRMTVSRNFMVAG